jgi:hypothetical protein
MARPKLLAERGQKFNRLTVLDPDLRSAPTAGEPYGRPAALCRCQCGQQVTVLVKSLVKGNTKSCGCLKQDVGSTWTSERLAAHVQVLRARGEQKRRLFVRRRQRFGRLSVIEPEVRDAQGGRGALCRCSCDGKQLIVPIKHLLAGNTRGCGCLNREVTAARNKTPEARARTSVRLKTHGLSKHPQYGIWKAMISRCHNPGDRAYPWYGAKGVAVCKEWHDVRNFIAWVEANPRPDDGRRMVNGGSWYSIDRIDVFGDYEPGNVRWATWEQQAVNKREVSPHFPEPPMECPACGENVASERAFDRHYAKAHKQKATA